MKKVFAFSVVIALIAASCGGGGGTSDLEKKKQELATYKAELEKLEEKIKNLEIEIAELDTSSTNPLKSKIVSVDTLKVVPFAHYIEIQGQVDSDENVFVSPEMPGVIKSVRVKEGDRVYRGSVMASTDAGALSNNLQSLKTSLALATTAYQKQKRLWDQNIGSEMQYLQAKTNMESLQSQVAALQSQIGMTRLKSPINGTVDEVKVKAGEMGNPGMNGIRVVNLNKMKVVAKVADTYLDRLKKGNNVFIDLPDIDRTMEAKISFISQVIDPNNRTVTIEVKVPNKEKQLRPNMIAKVKINDEMVDTAIVIPSNIIQRTMSGKEYVLIAEKENDKLFARKREIETGSNYNGNTMIISGLKPGDMIITFGYQDIVDGQPVYLK